MNKKKNETNVVQERVRRSMMIFQDVFKYYSNETQGWEKGILERIEENIDFYSGVGQWPKDLKSELKQEQRPALVINRCAPAINLVSGNERQNRTDIKPYAFEDGDSNYAFLMEYVLKHVHRYYNFDHINSEGFLQGAVSSEANWEYSVNVGADGLPTIERELLDAGSVLWDKNSRKYDRSDARYCVHMQWVSEDEVKELHPEIESAELDFSVEGKSSKSLFDVDHDSDEYNNENSFRKDYFYDAKNRQVRFIRVWEVHLEKEYIVRDKTVAADSAGIRVLSKNEIDDLGGLDELKLNDTLVVTSRMRPRISYHEISGEHEITYIEDISLTRIPVVSFYCFFIDGAWFSMVDLAKDRQLQINKTDSVMMDYIARLPKLGMIYESGAFGTDPRMKKRATKARVGDAVEVKSKDKIEIPQVRGLELISYYTALKKVMEDELKATLGTHDVLQGIKPKGAESGVAFQILRNQGMTVLEPIFDNFKRTKLAMGELEVELIQKFFNRDKFLRILGSLAQRIKDSKFLEVWEAAADDDAAKKKIVSALMVSKYDLVMDEGMDTPLIRNSNLLMVEKLMTAGFPVPPDLVVDLIEIGEDVKERWKMYIQQMQGMAAGSG